jgi:hypothetical protein
MRGWDFFTLERSLHVLLGFFSYLDTTGLKVPLFRGLVWLACHVTKEVRVPVDFPLCLWYIKMGTNPPILCDLESQLYWPFLKDNNDVD